MAKKERNQVILAKIETTYGTDSTPTGAANAILATNIQLEPLLGTEVSRDLLLPYLGNQGMVLSGTYGRIKFEVEVAGAGAAGTAPKYGPLLRACGMAEVITAATKVAYNFISASEESVTIWALKDGIKHILLGARGSFTIEGAPNSILRYVFTFTGLLGTISDAAMPAVTVTGFIKPVPVNKANTTLTLHGHAGACESFSFDSGIEISPRMLINSEKVEISDRVASGSVVFESVALATVDWFSKALAQSTSTMAIVHGTTAGNIVEFNAPKTQIGRPTYGATNKIMNNSVPIMFLPSAGNDEFEVAVR